jgi:hypothetical protein
MKAKGVLRGLALAAATTVCVMSHAAPISYSSTAGDQDFAADRDAYDNATNMDWYVFRTGSGISGPGTNSLGSVNWTYTLPNEIVTALSGSMTVRVWDIDPNDDMEVFFNLGGGNVVFAGNLTGSNGGNVTTWDNAVVNGTTASLAGWSTTTFNLGAATLAALSGTSGFNLDLRVSNAATEWAAVIDYAALTLRFEPGKPNAVPEPSALALEGFGPVHAGPRSDRMSTNRLVAATSWKRCDCVTKRAVRMSMCCCPLVPGDSGILRRHLGAALRPLSPVTRRTEMPTAHDEALRAR